MMQVLILSLLLASCHTFQLQTKKPTTKSVNSAFNNLLTKKSSFLDTQDHFLQKDTLHARGFEATNIQKGALVAVPILGGLSDSANALDFDVSSQLVAAKIALSQGDFNPETFKPICGTSDNVYRGLQSITQALVGPDAFVEYGPLIAGGLLRIRLELCVVESFFNEAVGPFIAKNGLNWVLPLHETVETFLAGSVFAAASTFILVGSTKIISVVFIYADTFVGAPCRLFGGFFFDRACGKPVTLDIGLGPWKTRVIGPPDEVKDEDGEKSNIGPYSVRPAAVPVLAISGLVKLVGETSRVVREVTEGVDTFVGRYLTVLATGYIAIKFLHFKVFPDFPAGASIPVITMPDSAVLPSINIPGL